MPHIYVEVDLDEFSDREIEREFYARGLDMQKTVEETGSEIEETQHLTRLRQLVLMGKRDEAFPLMYDYIVQKLGRVI